MANARRLRLTVPETGVPGENERARSQLVSGPVTGHYQPFESSPWKYPHRWSLKRVSVPLAKLARIVKGARAEEGRKGLQMLMMGLVWLLFFRGRERQAWHLLRRPSRRAAACGTGEAGRWP